MNNTSNNKFVHNKPIVEFYQAIYEHATDGIVILDKNGKYKYVSSSATRIYGYSFDDLEDLDPQMLTHPDDLPSLLPKLQELKHTPNAQLISEYRFKSKTGEWTWVESTFTNLLDDPNVQGLVINFRIIDDRRAYIERLKYISHLQTVVIEIGRNLMNATICEENNIKNDALEVLGRLIDADRTYIFSYDYKKNIAINTHEWCKDGVDPQISNLQNVPFDVMSYWPVKHAAGEVIEIPDMDLEPDQDVKQALSEQGIKSVLAIPILQQSNCIGFVGIDSVNKLQIFDINIVNILKLFTQQLSDYSKRRNDESLIVANETRYRLTQEVGEIGSWEYCIKTNEYWNSHQLRKLFGVENVNQTDAEEINRQIIATIVDYQKIEHALVSTIEQQIPYSVEFEIIRKNDNQQRLLYSKAELVQDDNCELTVVRGITRDITNERENELKLKQSEAILTATLQHSRFSIWSIDNNYKLLYANQKFISEYNASFDIELKVGESIISFLPEPIKNTWVEMYDKALSNNAFVVEIPVVYDDIEIYTEVSATPIVVDGVVVGVSFYGDNITERKQDQLNLLEKTEKLKTNAHNLHKTIVASSEFIKVDKINYDYVTQLLQQISGAKYVIFNWYEGEYSCAKSVSGFQNINQLTSKYLGFDVFSKKWDRHEDMDKMLTDNKINVVGSLAEILKYDFNEKFIKMILKLLGVGQIALVALNAKNRLVGNLIFIYEEKAIFENSELIEMFSYQLGQYIERTNAEVALLNKVDEMERFHRLTVNRELKMIELKKEINDLLQLAGKDPKYNILG